MIRKSIVLVAFLLCGVAAPASWLVRGVEPLVVKSFGTEISYFSADVVTGDLATKTQKTFQLSDEEVRWLKTNSKKGDFRKLLASSQSELAQEIEARVQAHQPLSLLVQTTEPTDRFVVQIDFDSNDRLECAVYARAAVCPVWIAKSVAASLALAMNGGKKGMSGLAKVAGTVLVGSAIWYGLMGEKNNAGNQRAGTPPDGATVPKSDQAKSNPVADDASGAGLGRRSGDAALSGAGLQIGDKFLTVQELQANRAAASRIIDDALRAYRLPCADVKDVDLLGNLLSVPLKTGIPEDACVPPFTKIVESIYLGTRDFTERLVRDSNTSACGLQYMDDKYEDIYTSNPETFQYVVMAAAERIEGFNTCIGKQDVVNGIGYDFVPMHEGCCPFMATCPMQPGSQRGISCGAKLSDDAKQHDFTGYDLFHNDFLPHAERCFALLDYAAANNRPLLVHCSAGSHRSASIVLAWMVSRASKQHSCWKCACFLRSKRGNVKDIAEVLRIKPTDEHPGRRPTDSSFATAARHYAAVRTGEACPNCAHAA